jgi:hypothetical protein
MELHNQATALSEFVAVIVRSVLTVALANKLARILWAMMKTGESFRTEMFAKA